MTNNPASIWRYLFGYLEASGGRLGLDLGVILGSILGSRARHAIFAKNSTAPQREHDFQRFGGSKNELKMGPKTASSGNLAPRASWEPPGLDFQAFWGSFWGSQIGRKTLPKMSRFWGPGPGGPRGARSPREVVKLAPLGARGETTEGGT